MIYILTQYSADLVRSQKQARWSLKNRLRLTLAGYQSTLLMMTQHRGKWPNHMFCNWSSYCLLDVRICETLANNRGIAQHWLEQNHCVYRVLGGVTFPMEGTSKFSTFVRICRVGAGGDSPVSQGDVPLSAILPLYRAAFTVLASRTVYLISDVLLTIYGACN